MEAILLSFATFVSTTIGGFIGLRNRDRLHYIMSFTAGVLLAVCFFDVLPEIFTITTENNLDITPALIAIVLGFLVIHTLEKIVMIHHAHEDEYANHRHPNIGLVGAGGLAFHSFLDGVGIGLGFHISQHVGLLISIAVLAHDFSDGLNTVTLMLKNNNTTQKTVKLLLLDAMAPVAGAVSTYIFTIPNNLLQIYLGFFVGFLLYISASDLLPEAHSKHSSFRLIGLTVLGVVFIFLITRFL